MVDKPKYYKTRTILETPKVSITYTKGTTLEEILDLLRYNFLTDTIIVRKKIVMEDSNDFL